MRKEGQRVSDDEFIQLFETHGPSGTANVLGIATRNVFVRRAKIEASRGIKIVSPKADNRARDYTPEYPARVPITLTNGIMLVGSDAHYWPGMASPAHRALVRLASELKPNAVVLNGDTVDGASISRHAPNGWERRPTLREELEAVEERTDEIRLAAGSASLLMTVGNHCMRFESRLANQAKEFDGIAGFKLKDHFPHWQFAMSFWVNDDVVIKHRFKGGVHATHNNALAAGKSIITGHLHSLKVSAYTDYNGTRYGVDTGTLADPCGPQFNYDEDNPKNHRSGFAVLTFHKGKLLMPELVRVIDESHAEFRGRVFQV